MTEALKRESERDMLWYREEYKKLSALNLDLRLVIHRLQELYKSAMEISEQRRIEILSLKEELVRSNPSLRRHPFRKDILS